MKIWTAGLFLFSLFGSLPAHAAIAPSFSLDTVAWNATDIVLVTEGDKIDGQFRILETWKGDLHPGDSVSVPELGAYAPESSREIKSYFYEKDRISLKYVTGSKMVLFLKKPAPPSQKWLPADDYFEVSVTWLEEQKAFSIVQISNPGPTAMTYLNLSDEKFKIAVLKEVETKRKLLQAAVLDDPTQRATALRAFVNPYAYYASQLAFEEIPKSGMSALPVLRSMLHDHTLRYQQGEIVEAMGKAGKEGVGPELTRMVEVETQFWKYRVRTLPKDWWSNSGTGLTEQQQEDLRNRYSKLLSALYALERMKFAGCRKAVTQLRDFWRSQPRLEDKSGLNQMSEQCDEVLKALNVRQ